MSHKVRFTGYVVVLAALVGMLLTGPSAWAIPGHSPDNQTVPTVTPTPPPENDHFASARVIGWFPFHEDTDTLYASTEPGEPSSSCSGAIYKTVWYAYRPDTDGSFMLTADSWYGKVVAVYTGSDLANLAEIGCRTFWYEGRLAFHGDAGSTYYIQVGSYNDEGGSLSFDLDLAPPPVASIGFWPSDPSIFDTIQFHSNSYDPAEIGIQTNTWDFGDGATSSDWTTTHQYTQDRDYTVNLTVTTFDGRTASSSQTVRVGTHDVAIVKLATPNTARVGQTRSIVVYMKNSRYPERVRIELYKSVPGGFQWVTSTEQNIPVRTGGRTTLVSMSYTFASEDALMGKVTFKASANIVNRRDALPADNEAISAPTKVGR